MIKTPLFENRCDKSRFEPLWEDGREVLNRSVRVGRIKSRHIKSLEGMESRSHDLGYTAIRGTPLFHLNAFRRRGQDPMVRT